MVSILNNPVNVVYNLKNEVKTLPTLLSSHVNFVEAGKIPVRFLWFLKEEKDKSLDSTIHYYNFLKVYKGRSEYRF